MTAPGMGPGADDVVCPFCRSADVAHGAHWETLLGAVGGTDPNHHQFACTCLGCAREFTKEWCRQRVCYSSDRRLVRGYPVCFERYENDPRAALCPHNNQRGDGDRVVCTACGRDGRQMAEELAENERAWRAANEVT